MAEHKGKGTASSGKSDSTYIGRHRPSNDVSTDPKGWSVGRGVSQESVTDHTRND